MGSALHKSPLDHVGLKRILTEWNSFEFDTDFYDYARTVEVVTRFEKHSEPLLQVIQEVRSFHFLTEYKSSAEFDRLGINTAAEVEPSNCLTELSNFLRRGHSPWKIVAQKAPLRMPIVPWVSTRMLFEPPSMLGM